jgi:hypothetical protein
VGIAELDKTTLSRAKTQTFTVAHIYGVIYLVKLPLERCHLNLKALLSYNECDNGAIFSYSHFQEPSIAIDTKLHMQTCVIRCQHQYP